MTVLFQNQFHENRFQRLWWAQDETPCYELLTHATLKPTHPRTRAPMLPTPPTHTPRHPRHPRYLANSRYNLHSTKVHPDQKGIDIMTSNLISFFE